MHWLPVQQRIRFKLGLIVYKTLNSGQPQYLKSVLIPLTYHYSMRSSDCLCLVIPKSRAVLGERAFSVSGPTFWNSLPVSVRCAQSLTSVISFSAENLPLSNCLSTLGCLSVSYGLIFWMLT